MVRIIEVVAPQDNWIEQFELEKQLLEDIYTQEIIALHHIGSTAIKNSKAKPVIDMLMVVKELSKVDKYNLEIEKIGYECLLENGISERRFFSKGGDNRSHHLHIFQVGNPEIKRHLIFKEFMNCHPEEVKTYSSLKETLAQQFSNDIDAYMAGKDAFIKNIDQKAEKWYDNKHRFRRSE